MGESTARRRDGMSDQALIEGTGADWRTWLALLDERGAADLDHAAIARLLVGEFEIDGWWAQSITVGYEQERGLREPGQRPDGTFSASASKTVAAPIGAAFEHLADPERQAAWAGGLELSQRSASPPKSVRFDAGDGSQVYANLTAKGDRTIVGIEIAKLASAEAAAAAKAAWKERLGRFAEGLG
ncbi:hypothetical protein SAMN05216298_0582 [Glycomyces sambucus]|uniref:DUF4287 domain-containing protein n=1 Tax=Glycomyces sambucus TaxID=380244 RepID=A0A1G9CYR0_9ACTN|nr:hypothetical protein [Glycomyces sambucus]SDK56818.1 hypothetical protein SAMN05216298_0582 [Glycomyces sambucus]